MAVVHIFQAGLGNVGRALIKKVLDYNHLKTGIRISYMGIANSRSYLFRPEGVDQKILEKLTSGSQKDQEMLTRQWETHSGNLMFVNDLFAGYYSCNPVFIDTTDSSTITPLLVKLAVENYRLVLANKKPLVQQEDIFRILMQSVPGIRATVGAGLPVVPAIRKMQENGPVVRAEGCFSGTMGVLCTAMESGQAFSEALREAYQKGYTEPDPREDLSGMDLARKILIVSRLSGYSGMLDKVEVENLFPKEMYGLSVEKFLERAQGLDAEFGDRFRQAGQRGVSLRMVAGMDKGRCSVGLKAYSKDSPIGQLQGAEKMVVLHGGNRDEERIIKGKGAGADNAAIDVLEDILELSKRNFGAQIL